MNPTSSASGPSSLGTGVATTTGSALGLSGQKLLGSDDPLMTGSLGGSSVNYLFSVDPQRKLKERQASSIARGTTAAAATPLPITVLPEESDAFLFSSSTMPFIPEGGGDGDAKSQLITSPSEEENQFP